MDNRNPPVSLRGEKTPFSPIRKFVPLLEKAKQEGKKVYEIHIGQPDLETPPSILKKIRGFKEKRLVYTPSPGIFELRKAWQEYYRNLGFDLDVSEIIATIGGSEAIFFAFSAVCDPREELLAFEPLYTTYNSYAALTGVRLIPFSTLPDTGFHLPNRKEMEKRITRKTKGILICNPNNPTGTVYSKRELQDIVDLSEEHNLFIISDETYREFVYDGRTHFSIMGFKQAHSRIILLDSVSKGLSACGSRIGCLVSKNESVIKTVTKFAQARLSLPMVEQKAVIPALQDHNKYAREIIPQYRKRRNAVLDALQGIPGVEFVKPEGAFYIMVTLPVEDSEHFTKWMLTDFSWQGETVMLSPASGFYVTPGLGRNQIRIAFVLSVSKLKRAIEILKKGLEAYPGIKN